MALTHDATLLLPGPLSCGPPISDLVVASSIFSGNPDVSFHFHQTVNLEHIMTVASLIRIQGVGWPTYAHARDIQVAPTFSLQLECSSHQIPTLIVIGRTFVIGAMPCVVYLLFTTTSHLNVRCTLVNSWLKITFTPYFGFLEYFHFN